MRSFGKGVLRGVFTMGCTVIPSCDGRMLTPQGISTCSFSLYRIIKHAHPSALCRCSVTGGVLGPYFALSGVVRRSGCVMASLRRAPRCC